MTEWRRARISPGSSIEEAVRVIDAADLELLVVLRADGAPLGFLTDFDIRLAIQQGAALDLTVGELLERTAAERAERAASRNGSHVQPPIDLAALLEGPDTAFPLPASFLADSVVILMAGGRGRRLYPLTKTRPKPLLEVGGRPLLDWTLENLRAQGVRRFYLSVNYLREMIESRMGDGSRWGMSIDYIREETPLDTAGALGLIAQRPTAPFLVMNADLLTTVGLRQLFQHHRRQGAEATVCVYTHDVQIPYGVVSIHGGRLQGIDERPLKRFAINAGIYVLEPSVLDLVPRNLPLAMPDLLKRLVASGRRTAVFPIREYWLDIGRKADLARANSDLLSLPAVRRALHQATREGRHEDSLSVEAPG